MKIRSSRGFTLLELLLACALSVVFTSEVIKICKITHSVWQKQQEYLSIQEKIQFMHMHFTAVIKNPTELKIENNKIVIKRERSYQGRNQIISTAYYSMEDRHALYEKVANDKSRMLLEGVEKFIPHLILLDKKPIAVSLDCTLTSDDHRLLLPWVFYVAL